MAKDLKSMKAFNLTFVAPRKTKGDEIFRIMHCITLIMTCFFSMMLHATTWVLPPTGDLVGEIQYATAESNETIDEIGKRFSMGFYELARANPQVDSIHSLAANTSLMIPSQFILPKVPRTGIVINLAEYRLYYFPPNENVVITFPVGIGREGWKTPLGLTKIVAKQANPTWHPTSALQAAALEQGVSLPDEFPSGPYNPLGQYALRLGWPTFLIHGSNRSDGIGTRVSAGCLRMFPDDIEQLFKLVPVGTAVRVINEPVKIGQQNGSLFLQVYPLLVEEKQVTLRSLLHKKLENIDIEKNKVVQKELVYPSGVVRKI